MPTIIDALLVTIGLDPAKFKKGAKEVTDTQGKLGKAATDQQKKLDAMGKKGAEAVGKIRNELLKTAAAFIGLKAVESFVTSVTRSDIALGNMATRANTSMQSLSSWKLAADAAGSSGDTLAASLQGIVESVARFSATGEGGEAFKYFRALGISLVNAKGEMRDVNDIALESSAALSKMTGAQAQVFGKGMGYSPSDIDFLRQGPAAVKAFYDEAAKANARTPQDKAAALERQKAWALLTATFSRLATNVLNVVTPALTGLLNLIRDHAGAATILIGGVATALVALSVVRFVGLISQLSQLAGALRGVGAAAALAGAEGAGAGVGGAGMGVAGKAGIYGAAAVGAYQIWNLGSALKDWWDIKHRDGVKLSAYAQSRMNGGAAPGAAPASGGGADSGKAAYMASLEKQFGLPTGLLDSVWLQESSRGKKMLSTAGAKGHFGQMDKTAAAYGVLDPNDFGQSAMGAARMFRDLLSQYKGNLPMALAAYNEGSGNLAKRGMGNLPMETANYIPSVMGRLAGGGGGAGGSTTTMEVNIGAIHTKATDAAGIARTLPDAIHSQQLALQANTGPQ